MDSQRDRDTERLEELLLTGPARFLLWLYSQRDTVRLGDARRRLGTKVYSNAYKLALSGLVSIDEYNNIKLTEYGAKIASCLYSCLHSTNHRKEGD